MKGGINEWEGLVAEGGPELAISYFSSAGSAAEYIVLAWLLEDGTRKFYEEASSMIEDREATKLFRDLTSAEEHHKHALAGLYKEVQTKPGDAGFQDAVASTRKADDLMEGGMRVEDALHWARGKHPKEILELSIAMESNAYDRYLIMRREAEDEQSKRVFQHLSDEEMRHLERLTSVFERMLQP